MNIPWKSKDRQDKCTHADANWSFQCVKLTSYVASASLVTVSCASSPSPSKASSSPPGLTKVPRVPGPNPNPAEKIIKLINQE